MGLAGAGNVGTVLWTLCLPLVWRRRLAGVRFSAVAVIPAVVVLVAYAIFSKEAAVEFKKKRLLDYGILLKDKDAHWFCFYYTVSFGGFVGLASSYVLYFKSEFGLPAVHAGECPRLFAPQQVRCFDRRAEPSRE